MFTVMPRHYAETLSQPHACFSAMPPTCRHAACRRHDAIAAAAGADAATPADAAVDAA